MFIHYNIAVRAVLSGVKQLHGPNVVHKPYYDETPDKLLYLRENFITE